MPAACAVAPIISLQVLPNCDPAPDLLGDSGIGDTMAPCEGVD